MQARRFGRHCHRLLLGVEMDLLVLWIWRVCWLGVVLLFEDVVVGRVLALLHGSCCKHCRCGAKQFRRVWV
jgi:hypothetical protein